MSGFAGIVRFGGTHEQVAEEGRCLEQMARAIAFRGPDANEFWRHADVQFCFSLLKTNPAIQAKTLPCSLDGRIWLLGDVRLDGREDQIRRFSQRGEKLASSVTDEELVLHTFHAFGETGVAELDGDYAFVLWDAKKKTLLGFRDLTGSKPFFYFAANNLLCFSNTLDSLRESPGFDAKLDEQFLADYLLVEWCPDMQRTAYEKIRRLPPGFLLEFSQEGLQVRKAAHLPIEQLLRYKSEEEYVSHYRDILHRAVTDRLSSGTNVVFLSGGLDSTTVAAEANRIGARVGGAHRLTAQSIDYRPLFEDREGEEARRVAEYLEIPFELIHGGECEPFSGWDPPNFATPEPIHEPFQALHVQRHRQAAHAGRVALSGDGGDDVLLGQAGPYARNLLRQGHIVTVALELVRQIWNTKKLPTLGLGIRSGISARFGSGRLKEKLPDWLLPGFVARLQLQDRLHELRKKPQSEHPNHPWAYAMLTGPFWPNILEGEDAAWSGVPLEVRAPLLDRRMLRFLLRLPAIPWCMEKQLVRRAMVGLLPKETLSRPKAPLASDPVWLHVKKGWRPGIQENISPLVAEMVDVKRLQNCTQNAELDQTLSSLKPVTLDRWLKSIEMKRGIQ
ncbi:MAG: lasso peptide isopeptide bond-forming cyclase [Candidatus Acidiferrum sp.]